jgi:hypothetical protein
MSTGYLDLSDAPDDAIERLMWLSGMAQAVKEELDLAFGAAYFEARLQRRIATARALQIHSNKRILAYTRAENERRGRIIRWGDNNG